MQTRISKNHNSIIKTIKFIFLYMQIVAWSLINQTEQI